MPLRLRLVNLNKDFPMVDVGVQTPEQGQLAQDFVRFAVESGVLRFGEFKTKAGRLSPYFSTPDCLTMAARLAARGILCKKPCWPAASNSTWCLAPPTRAFRWLPPWPWSWRAWAATCLRLQPQGGQGPRRRRHPGGRAPQGQVLIVDDVMSAYTAARESIAIIKAAGATPHAVAIALDRQEKPPRMART